MASDKSERMVRAIMAKTSEVSVIIPAYNADLSLRRTIDSALDQTVLPTEIFVIDDGSTDNTIEVANQYADKIKLIKQENRGQGAARNKALKLAKGDYIAFLDADDYWNPRFLETCVEFLEEHQDIVAVSTGLIIKFENGRERIAPKCLLEIDGPKKPRILKDFFNFWAEQDHVRTGSTLIRKSVIDKAGLQREDLRVSQDLEYWGYIATFGEWGFIPEPLWVGNSRAVAIKQGWLEKYRLRRKLCPTVEAWEQRIVPKLKQHELSAFSVVRGRVAAGFMHNKIIAGDQNGALEIVKKYGKSMPRNRLTFFVLSSAKLGRLGWFVAVFIVKLKEYFRAWKLT